MRYEIELNEVRKETEEKNAIAMLKNGKLSYQEIVECSGLSLEEVLALKDELR